MNDEFSSVRTTISSLLVLLPRKSTSTSPPHWRPSTNANPPRRRSRPPRILSVGRSELLQDGLLNARPRRLVGSQFYRLPLRQSLADPSQALLCEVPLLDPNEGELGGTGVECSTS
ncbi:hypothetical protein ABZP36_015769 [Zizania latifolia]